MRKRSGQAGMIAAAAAAALLWGAGSAAVLPPFAFAAEETPSGVQRHWISTSSSATTYWNRDNGQYLGNGSGTAIVYGFDSHGGFTYYVYAEVRTGSYVSRIRNSAQGTVTFSGDSFSLHPTTGHYHTEFGSTINDRTMTAEDKKRIADSGHWRLAKGDDGKPRLTLQFASGNKVEFRVLPEGGGKS